jgi:hypothetical protein
MKTMTFKTKKAIVEALKNIDETSRYLSLQLVALGYVDVVKEKTKPGRGRCKVNYVVNGKGRGLVALAKNWK